MYKQVLLLTLLIAANATSLYAANADSLLALGHKSREAGDTDTAISYYQQALTQARVGGDSVKVATIYHDLGSSWWSLRDYVKAHAYLSHYYRLQQPTATTAQQAQMLENLALLNTDLLNYELAITQHLRVLKLKQQLNNNEGISFTYNNLGIVYAKWGQPDKALEYYLRALTIREDLGDPKLIASTLNNIGLIYRHLNLYAKAEEYYLKSVSLLKQVQDNAGLGYIYTNLGNVYLEWQHLDKAAQTLTKALELRLKGNDPRATASVYNHLGLVSEARQDYQAALNYHSKALKLRQQADDQLGTAISQANLALIYTHLGKTKLALQNYKGSLAISKKIGDKIGVVQTTIRLADLLITLKQYRQAKKYLQHALDLATELDAHSLQQQAYSSFYNLYAAQQNYTKALVYFQNYSTLKDTLYARESRNRVAELQSLYRLQGKEKEIANLKTADALQKSKIYRQKIQRNFILLTLALVLGLIVLLYRFYRTKVEDNKLLNQSRQKLQQANDTKDKFFSIIAHDLRGPIGNLRTVLTGINKNLERLDQNTVRQLLDMAIADYKNTFNLLENLLFWARSQQNQFHYKFQAHNLQQLTNNTLNLLLPLAEAKQQTVTCTIEPNLHIWADEYSVSTIIRNLVSNAIKFTPSGGQVNITAKLSRQTVVIQISDTGVGIKQTDLQNLFNPANSFSTVGTNDEQGTGMGLVLAHEFAIKNNGTLTATSTVGKGSTFALSLPAPPANTL